METRCLTDSEYKQTLSHPVQDVTGTCAAPLDIWPYVAAVTLTDLEGHAIYDRFVEHVYRSADCQFDHVLVMTKTPNVYLAIVVNLQHDTVYGHCLLDLNREYRLSSASIEGDAGDR
jgi:hypothetical protein